MNIARAQHATANWNGELEFGDEAKGLWVALYPELGRDRPGLGGAFLARSRPLCVRLALLYAILDGYQQIGRRHLEAAHAVLKFSAESAIHVFGDLTGDPMADELLRALRRSPTGLTRTGVRDLFGRHHREEEIERVLDLLLGSGLATRTIEATGGRPAERWMASPINRPVTVLPFIAQPRGPSPRCMDLEPSDPDANVDELPGQAGSPGMSS